MTDAVAVREETMASYEAKGQPEQIGLAHVRLAFSLGHIGQFDSAQKHANIGLELCHTQGDQRGAGLALFILSNLAMSEGEIDRAEHLMQESVNNFRGVEGEIDRLAACWTGDNCLSSRPAGRFKGLFARRCSHSFRSVRHDYDSNVPWPLHADPGG